MLAVVLAGYAGAQQKKSDIEHAGLKGKVKTIKVEEAKLSNKSGKPAEGKRVQLETQNYGENGMLVKSVRYDAEKRGDYFYSYDSSGNRLEFIRNATSSSRVKTEFKYDANGYRLEEVQTGDEGLVAKIVSVYDAKGLRTGNWTKRITSAQGMSNGKPVSEPAAVTYRTITYY